MADSAVSTDRVRFGPFELDVRARELRKGPTRLKVPDQSIAVLMALLERPGDLVTREELKNRLWPAETFVDFEQGLNGVVRRLREALGDAADSPRYIETLPRRGYRFIGTLEAPSLPEEPTAAARVPLPSKWFGLVGAAALMLIAAMWVLHVRRGGEGTRGNEITIAVLPFEIAPGADHLAYLGTGLADEISSRLALVTGIRVRPTSAVVNWQTRWKDQSDAARALSVTYLLVGVVQPEGDAIRITPRLIRVSDGVGLWTRDYTRPPNDLLGLHSQIAGAVIDALKLQISREQRERVDRRYTTNAEAYVLYLQGRSHLVRSKPEAARTAFSLFELAAARDSQFALAWAGQAVASAQMRLFFADEPDVTTWEKHAQDAARRAFGLDPNLAEVHEALAAIYRSADFDWPGAIEESNEALRLNPNLDMPHLYRASAFSHLGLLDRVPAETKAAMTINQLNTVEPLRVLGVSAMFDGRFKDAVAFLQKAAQTGKVAAEWNLANALYYADRKSEAEDMLRNLHGSARNERRGQATLASFLAARGEHAQALKLIQIVTAAQYRDHHVTYSLGVAHAQLGHVADAIRWLTEAQSKGFPCVPWFERDRLLDPIRSAPEFGQLIDQMKRRPDVAAARQSR
jgi:DNA-binding winged helix-turn-helix (wHTH) protein/TolB-like protein/tetratricopeptide (TPR) repeat protein